jgi:hypothetical protein
VSVVNEGEVALALVARVLEVQKGVQVTHARRHLKLRYTRRSGSGVSTSLLSHRTRVLFCFQKP